MADVAILAAGSPRSRLVFIRREAIWNNYMPGREVEFETW
jgi:hypothetical protein